MAGPSIDVGLLEDMGSIYPPSRTVVNVVNPANATGLVTLVNIWANGTCENVKVAAFTASGNDLTTRGYASLGNLASGDNEFDADVGDFTPFEIRTGDYIGAYCTAAGGVGIDGNATGGANVWYASGDEIPCSGVTFTLQVGREVAISAGGFQLGHINIGDSWKVIQNIQINIGDAWKQITLGSKINIADVWKEILH